MKRINIDGHDNIKGDVCGGGGSPLAHCVQSVNWEGAYQFTYVVKWRDEPIVVHLIKEPNQNGSLQIKVDGMYVEHMLSYGHLKRGAEEFRYNLYSVIKNYYKES